MASLAARRQKMARDIDRTRKRIAGLDKSSVDDTVRFMKELRRDVRTAMIGAEGFKMEHLSGIKNEITNVINRFDSKINAMVAGNQTKAWDMGVNLVDGPLNSAEVRTALPLLTETQLLTLQDFSADLVKGITDGMKSRINSIVSLGVAGEKSVFEAAREIDTVIGIGKKRGITARAARIARTEIGRAQSIASQLRMEQAKEQVPELKKQWLSSLIPGTRPSHGIGGAHGQVVDVNDFFIVGGQKALEPRDPRLSAAEAVNCVCNSVPYFEEFPDSAGEQTSVQAVSKPKPAKITKAKRETKAEELSKEQWAKTLNTKELTAIDRWQGSGFERIREYQKTGQGGSAVGQATKDLQTALNKSPKFKGNSFRGLNNLDDKSYNFLKKQKSFKWDALSSSSSTEKGATRFLNSSSKNKRSVMFKIKNKSGVDITPVVGKEESEVLLRKGAKYRVIGQQDKTFIFNDNPINALEMTLEEI